MHALLVGHVAVDMQQIGMNILLVGYEMNIFCLGNPERIAEKQILLKLLTIPQRYLYYG